MFAVRAFRFAAVDYLLKPVEPELLKTAVQRAKEHSVRKRQDLMRWFEEKG